MLDEIKKDAGERMGKSVAALKQELTKMHKVVETVKAEVFKKEGTEVEFRKIEVGPLPAATK